MKVFKTLCIDNETRHRLILSECSYNEACSYIESSIPDLKDVKARCSVKTDITDLYITLADGSIKHLIYDETRGYLLLNLDY